MTGATLTLSGEKHLQVFILLDRSGSMRSRMEGALEAINAYVADLALHPETRAAAVSLLAFDVGPILSVREAQRVDLWRPVLLEEVNPRSATTLFDAIRVVAGVIEATLFGSKTVLLVQTDGEENASVDTTKAAARNYIERLQERGVQVLFLGADFDAFTDAQNVGVASSSTITASGAAGLRTTLDAVARETKAFASGMVASMEFSEADREAARDDSLRSWDGRRATRLNLSFASRLPAVLAAHVLQQTKSPGSGANGPGCLRISASYTTGLG